MIQSFGGRLSPSQSLPSAVDYLREQGSSKSTPPAAADFGGLDQSLLTGEGGRRFATPYLKRVFAADARAQELKREGRWEGVEEIAAAAGGGAGGGGGGRGG